MNEILMITLFLLILLVIIVSILTLLIVKRKKEGTNKEPDYRVFFILGICFLPMGIPLFLVTNNPGLISFTAIGICYLAIGLANRDKWKDV